MPSPGLFSLEGKVAIVTGGLGLLGTQHCEALADAGATVVVADLDQAAAQKYAGGLKTSPASIGIGVDITRPESVAQLRDMVLRQCGGIHILVNNAAINDMVENPSAATEQSKFEHYPLDLWKRALDVNVTGMFLCCQSIGTHMANAGGGSIINIASTYGVVAPDQSLYRRPDGTQSFYKSAAYPVTKGAVISFTRFLAAYWGSAGVRINTLSPGGVENNQDPHFISEYSARTPLGRMAHPRDYQGAIVFLASDASRYMTGANLIVDGGWTAW
jgi:NAD(P)-dependent dehydrogenase (short-subunit alcohol dehydrogenase family)